MFQILTLCREGCPKNRNTGEGEIVAASVTASYHRHDVVDMKGRFLTRLRKAAVLASVTGTPDNEPAESGRHAEPRFYAYPARCARSFRSERSSAKSTRPSASRRSLRVSSSPRSWRSSRPCRRSSTPRGSWKRSRSSGSSSLKRTCRDVQILSMVVRRIFILHGQPAVDTKRVILEPERLTPS